MKKSRLSVGSFLTCFLSFLFLYLPILTLIIFSFNTSRFPSAWDQFTLKWYHELFKDQEIWLSFGTSLFIATLSTLISLTMGTLLLFFKETGGRIKAALPLFYGNLFIPETMLALSLVSYFAFFNVKLGMTTLVIAHTVLGLGLLVPILYVSYLNLDPKIKEASQVLGATPRQTFIKVTLPLLRPTLTAMGLLIFVLSFDDFILSYFCAGNSVETVSIYLLSMLRSGISPTINALSTFLFLFTTILVMLFFSPKIRSKIL